MVQAVFIHLPKTAGTSFRDALYRGFGEHAVSPPFVASYLTEEDADRLRGYDVVSGHISFEDIKRFFPEAATFTILREPIDRCLSWYYYARQQAPMDFPDVTAAQTHSVEDYFALDPKIVFRNIYNRQVRQLGAHVLDIDVDIEAAFQQSLKTLAACAWVGRYESLADDMAGLAAIFPQMDGITIPFLNVTAGRIIKNDVSENLKERIARYNAYDLKLYS